MIYISKKCTFITDAVSDYSCILKGLHLAEMSETLCKEDGCDHNKGRFFRCFCKYSKSGQEKKDNSIWASPQNRNNNIRQTYPTRIMSLINLKIFILQPIKRFQFQVSCFAHKPCICVSSRYSHHLDHKLHVYHTCCFVSVCCMLLTYKWQSGMGCNVEKLALKVCLFKNSLWDHSGKCLVNAQRWHVMIDKTCNHEPQQTPKRRPKVISSSPGQLYNWAWGRW